MSERRELELKRALHELRVHQLELEMQNRELRKTRALLEESRDRYADLYDFAPLPYLTLTERGLIREINLNGAKLLGKERRMLIGMPLEEWLTGKDARAFAEHLRQCAEMSRAVVTELEIRNRNGEFVPVRMISAPFVHSGPEPRQYRTALLDLTESRKVEEQRESLMREQAARAEIEEINQIKDEFLSVLSHELRTPLQIILGRVQLLRELELPADAKRSFEAVERAAIRQAELVDNLLDVSSILSGKLSLELETYDLDAIILETKRAFHDQIVMARLTFEIKGIPTGRRMKGDPTRLFQAIGQVIKNSIKFTPPGGKIELDIETSGRAASIRISDTGCGISPEFIPYLFDRFRQYDSSSTRRHGGLGLGLSIVKYIVENHGGSVHAESRGPGKGSVFIMTVPLLLDQLPGLKSARLFPISASTAAE